jgi:hypothetical protein
MTRSPLEDVLGQLIDVVRLTRRAVRLRLSLARADLSDRLVQIIMALVLLVLVLVLGVMVLGLLVQAALLGLGALGLTPLQALLAVSLGCVVLAMILMVAARLALRRALRPLSSSMATGTDLPTRRP